MKFRETRLKGLFIIEPEPYCDSRGYFGRIYCKNELKKIDHQKEILQINRSLTKIKGTIRGMHFQYPPMTEIKIISCISGSIFDVAIDLRQDSATFLKWHGEILNNEKMNALYVPEGFAHGFQTLEDNCELLYFHSEIYSLQCEGSIRYDDPVININWPLEATYISEKDKNISFITQDFKGISL